MVNWKKLFKALLISTLIVSGIAFVVISYSYSEVIGLIALGIFILIGLTVLFYDLDER